MMTEFLMGFLAAIACGVAGAALAFSLQRVVENILDRMGI